MQTVLNSYQSKGKLFGWREKMGQTENEKSFNRPDETRDAFMLKGNLASEGIDQWFHSFYATSKATGKRRAFYLHFFGINPKPGSESQKSYFLVKAGALGENGAQLNRFFSWEDVTIGDESSLMISAEECFLSETRTMGRISVSQRQAAEDPERYPGSGDLVWDITIEKQIAFNLGYPSSWASRELDALQFFWHAQGMKTHYSGFIKYNGEEYEVSPDTSYGYADKLWGRDTAVPWILIEANHLHSRLKDEELTDSAIVSVGASPKVGPISMEEKLVSAIWYEGEPFEFNFSKLWTLTRTSLRFREKRKKRIWILSHETPTARIKMQLAVDKTDCHDMVYDSITSSGHKERRIYKTSKSGIGRMKLYRKRLTDGKWAWELVDDIDIRDAGCVYTDRPAKLPYDVEPANEKGDIKREIRQLKQAQKEELKSLRRSQKQALKMLKRKRKETEEDKRSYHEISPKTDK